MFWHDLSEHNRHRERMAEIARRGVGGARHRPAMWPQPDPNAEAIARGRAHGRRAAELEHNGKVVELQAEVERLEAVIAELRGITRPATPGEDTAA